MPNINTIPIGQTPEQIAAAKAAADAANVNSQFNGANPATGERYIVGDLSLNPQLDPSKQVTPTRYTSATDSAFGAGGAYGVRSPYTQQEEQALKDAETKKVQASIDAINVLTEQELGKARARAAQASGSNRARLSATGQLGAGSETTSTDALAQKAAEESKAIEAERTLRIQGIYKDVDKTTTDLIKARKDEAVTNTDKYLADLKGKSTESLSRVTELAKLGADISPEYKKQLIEQSGLDATTFDNYYNALKVANTAKSEIVGEPVKAGSKLIYTIRDPKSPNGLKLVVLDTGVDLEKGDFSITSDSNGIYLLDKNTGTYKKIGDPAPKEGEDPNSVLSISEAEKLGVPFGTTRAQAIAMNKTPGGTGGPSDVESQFNVVSSSLKNAKDLAHAAGRGRSWAEAIKQGLIGATEYTNLETYANTLRTNILALAVNPDIKKFFGPQMTNRDVELMTSTGTSLNPELQGPTEFKQELENLEKLFVKLAGAKNIKFGGDSRILRSPDGTQEVNVSDLTPDQVKEAETAGWK